VKKILLLALGKVLQKAEKRSGAVRRESTDNVQD